MHKSVSAVHKDVQHASLNNLVINYQCPNCRDARSSYKAAHRHMRNAIKKGYCKADRTMVDHKVEASSNP